MKRTTTTLLVLFLFATGLFAAGVDLTGVGVRATTLGGNYRALSNDWSGMFWNPAGLVFSKGLQVGASVEYITPTSGYTPLLFNDKNFSSLRTGETKNEPKSFLMPAFGVYYSTEKYAFGLGFWAPFGLGAKWDLLDTDTYNTAYPKYDYEDDLKILALQPTFAYKVLDNLSVGLGVSFIYADIMIRKPNFTSNPFVSNPKLAPLAAALPASIKSAPFDQILTESNMTGNGMGFGANVGIQWKPFESLSFGVSAKYYSNITLDGKLSATTYFANYPQIIPAIKPSLDGMLAGGLIDQATYQQLLGVYSGQKNNTVPEMTIKADLPLPLNVGFGVAFTGIKNLTLSADVAMTQWSSWDIIKVEDKDGKEVAELKENWENGIRMGLGLEYSLGFAQIRGSFYTEPRAAIDETLTPTIPDINARNVLLLGIGVPIGPAKIGLMFEKIFMSDYKVEKWSTTDGFMNNENMAGTYSMDVFNIMLGVDVNL